MFIPLNLGLGKLIKQLSLPIRSWEEVVQERGALWMEIKLVHRGIQQYPPQDCPTYHSVYILTNPTDCR